jgi:hypothetical protein
VGPPLAYPQIFRRLLAPVRDNIERNLGALIEAAKARSFYGRDVHEHVLAAAIRRDEAITFLSIKPLHFTSRHVLTPFENAVVAVERRSRRWASKNPPA